MSAITAPPAGVVLAHPSGNQFFRHLAAALRDAGRLAALCTCLDWRRHGPWDRVLPRRIAAELGRRDFGSELGVPVESRPGRELLRLALGRLGWRGPVRHETGWCSVDAVYRDFDDWVARSLPRRRGVAAVYAYEDGAAATFAAAAQLGWRRAYDLPIAHWATSRRLLAEEAERWPEWEPTLVGTRDSAEKLARKTRELELAELVVCPSRFVAESVPPDSSGRRRVIVAPFGSPEPAAIAPAGPTAVRGDERLRVLFAGSMSQRKGLADLFAAVRLLGRADVELVVMGSPVAAPEFYRRQGVAFTYEPPRPHAAVLELMRCCDVLCLPSIVEGRALVVQEALSCGLPVIVTAHTGADDAVREGRNGFVVPIRAPAALAEKLAWFADRRADLPMMAAEARAAAARFTWSGYGATILDALDALTRGGAK